MLFSQVAFINHVTGSLYLFELKQINKECLIFLEEYMTGEEAVSSDSNSVSSFAGAPKHPCYITGESSCTGYGELITTVQRHANRK